MNKHINKIFTALLLIIFLAGCKDFEELNTNPTKSAVVNPNAQLSYVQLLSWGDWTMNEPFNSYSGSFVQLVQGDYNVTNWGGQYRRSNTLMAQTWNRIYGVAIKNLVDVINYTEDKPLYQNVRAVSRIFKVYYFMLLTDTFGDVPYFDAGKGYTDLIVTPAYDKQELIYHDFLKELKEAEAALTSDGGSISGDLVYKGDIQKWKRFANSLRLRLAMRLTKVDPALAEQEVTDVAASPSGFLGTSDNALVTYMDLNDWDSNEFRRNALSQIWHGRETYPTPFICSTFWNYLKNTNDPRLLVYCRSYDETASAANNPFNRVDLTDEIVAKQGLSKFQPCNPGFFWYNAWPGGYWSTLTNKWQDKACRPQVNNAFLRGNAPGVLLTYAEVQLLLAEAKVRWASAIPGSATAETYYKNGVTAAMQLLAQYNTTPITTAAINGYFSAHPFPAAAESRLQTINEQLWILHFNNPAEAYANWRRSGYPRLKSSAEYGAITIESSTIPRRLNYPFTEASYNKAAYDAALAAMGGTDDWNKPVWWDKQ